MAIFTNQAQLRYGNAVAHPPTILVSSQSNPSAQEDSYSHTVTALTGSYQ